MGGTNERERGPHQRGEGEMILKEKEKEREKGRGGGGVKEADRGNKLKYNEEIISSK